MRIITKSSCPEASRHLSPVLGCSHALHLLLVHTKGTKLSWNHCADGPIPKHNLRHPGQAGQGLSLDRVCPRWTGFVPGQLDRVCLWIGFVPEQLDRFVPGWAGQGLSQAGQSLSQASWTEFNPGQVCPRLDRFVSGQDLSQASWTGFVLDWTGFIPAQPTSLSFLPFKPCPVCACSVPGKHIPAKPPGTQPQPPQGCSKSHLRNPCCPCDPCTAWTRHPEWTQREENILFFSFFFKINKSCCHQMQTLQTPGPFIFGTASRFRFTQENEIGHPSFPFYILFSVQAFSAGGRLQDGGGVWKTLVRLRQIFSASCCSANEVCNFLYLQHERNKVTRNCSLQILKEAKFLKHGTSCKSFFFCPGGIKSGLQKSPSIHPGKIRLFKSLLIGDPKASNTISQVLVLSQGSLFQTRGVREQQPDWGGTWTETAALE